MNVEDPAVVGAPLRTPDAARVTPDGREPAVTLNVYGPKPPLAVSVDV